MIMNSLTLVRALSFFATTAIAAMADVVINEIHYDPADKTVPDEFVEVYNSGAQAVDLSGWTLSGVGFTFPANTSIAPKSVSYCSQVSGDAAGIVWRAGTRPVDGIAKQ